LQTLEGPAQGVSWIYWHPRGNALLAGSEDCSAWLWLAPQNKSIAVFMGHTGPVECGAMTADGKLCVTGSADTSVRVWKPKEGTCAHVIQAHNFHKDPIVSLCVSPVPGNSAILSGDEVGGLYLSNLEGHIMGSLVGHTVR
jgi:WD40 repeat protein